MSACGNIYWQELDSVAVEAVCTCAVVEVSRVPGKTVYTYNAMIEKFLDKNVTKRVQQERIKRGQYVARKGKMPFIVICEPLAYVTSCRDGYAYIVEVSECWWRGC